MSLISTDSHKHVQTNKENKDVEVQSARVVVGMGDNLKVKVQSTLLVVRKGDNFLAASSLYLSLTSSHAEDDNCVGFLFFFGRKYKHFEFAH